MQYLITEEEKRTLDQIENFINFFLDFKMSNTYNICILGEKGCGKTCFLLKHINGLFYRIQHRAVRNMEYNIEFKSEKKTLISR